MHVNAVDINNVFANLQMVGYTFTSLSRDEWVDIDEVSALESVMMQYVYSPPLNRNCSPKHADTALSLALPVTCPSCFRRRGKKSSRT
jgi:hypothetical protein